MCYNLLSKGSSTVWAVGGWVAKLSRLSQRTFSHDGGLLVEQNVGMYLGVHMGWSYHGHVAVVEAQPVTGAVVEPDVRDEVGDLVDVSNVVHHSSNVVFEVITIFAT